MTLSKMWALVAALTPPVKMELEMYCSSTWPGMGEKGWLLGLSREEEERRMKLTREEDGCSFADLLFFRTVPSAAITGDERDTLAGKNTRKERRGFGDEGKGTWEGRLR